MRNSKTIQLHRCGDAFKLYWYACVGNQSPRGSTVVRVSAAPPCGHRELIWNSRDGVVPFGSKCPSCEHGMLQHVDWHLDMYGGPNYVLRPFQKYWADMTEERARIIAKRVVISAAEYARKHPGAGYSAPVEQELVKHYLSEFDGHAPMLCIYQGP